MPRHRSAPPRTHAAGAMLRRRACRLLQQAAGQGWGGSRGGGGALARAPLYTDSALVLRPPVPHLRVASPTLEAWRLASWHAARALLGTAVPLTVAELSRGAWLFAHVNTQVAHPPRVATAAADLALHRLPLALAVRSVAEVVLTLVRAAHLVLLFAPLLATAPLCLLQGIGRAQWMEALNSTLRAAGPAFIKWGQV